MLNKSVNNADIIYGRGVIINMNKAKYYSTFSKSWFLKASQVVMFSLMTLRTWVSIHTKDAVLRVKNKANLRDLKAATGL